MTMEFKQGPRASLLRMAVVSLAAATLGAAFTLMIGVSLGGWGGSEASRHDARPVPTVMESATAGSGQATWSRGDRGRLKSCGKGKAIAPIGPHVGLCVDVRVAVRAQGFNAGFREAYVGLKRGTVIAAPGSKGCEVDEDR